MKYKEKTAAKGLLRFFSFQAGGRDGLRCVACSIKSIKGVLLCIFVNADLNIGHAIYDGRGIVCGMEGICEKGKQGDDDGDTGDDDSMFFHDGLL